MENNEGHTTPDAINGKEDHTLRRRVKSNRPLFRGRSHRMGKDKNGVPERNRTPNLLVRSQTLYPIELRVRKNLPKNSVAKRRRAMQVSELTHEKSTRTPIVDSC